MTNALLCLDGPQAGLMVDTKDTHKDDLFFINNDVYTVRPAETFNGLNYPASLIHARPQPDW